MTVQNSVRSYLGIARETTKGTVVAPTDFIPVMKDSLKPVDIIDPLYDEGLRGSLVKNYNYLQGRTRSTVDFGGSVFIDTAGWAIAGLLGDETVTGGSAPYTHVISLKNASAVGADAQPPSYTLTDFYAADVRSYPGCQFSDFSLKFNADGMLEYDAKSTGWASEVVATPTPSFSTVLPTQVWHGRVEVAGTPVSNSISGNIDMKRPVTPIYGISETQNPYQVFLGALEVTGKIKFVMENDDQLTNFLTNTQPSLRFIWSYGTGANELQLSAVLTKGAYVAAAIDRGTDMVEIEVDINAQGNLTDAGNTGGYSPIKWTLKNAVPTNIYLPD
jgi:hypothetical protein